MAESISLITSSVINHPCLVVEKLEKRQTLRLYVSRIFDNNEKKKDRLSGHVSRNFDMRRKRKTDFVYSRLV